MKNFGSYLEARVSAGNFILGLMLLLLGYEYITSSYMSRFPDYRLSYLIGAVTVAYFLALRFVNYKKRRGLSVLASAVTRALDLLAVLGVVGLALEYGNYPVAFLLDVDPALYSFVPAGSVSLYVLTGAFLLFVAPKVAAQLILPPVPKLTIESPAQIRMGGGNFEDLVPALERRASDLKSGVVAEGSGVTPRNVKLLLRLSRVVETLRLMWPGLELDVLARGEAPPMVELPSTIRRRQSSEWSGLTVLAPTPATPLEKEALTQVLNDNPWAVVLSKRALRGSRQQE